VDDESGVSDPGRSVGPVSATAPIEPLGMTAEELFDLPDDGMRHELVEGELRTMTPAGYDHGRAVMRIGARILEHVEAHDLGEVLAAETGFVVHRRPDTVRAPDVAFVAHDRVPQAEVPGFPDLVPDLVVEVVSPSDRASDVSAKAAMWVDAGVRLVWIVDPQARLATVYRPGGLAAVVGADGSLDGEDVLPGLRLALRSIFP
jgi:Uma2 family endonuclease